MKHLRLIAWVGVILAGIVAFSSGQESSATRKIDQSQGEHTPEAMIRTGRLIESRAAECDGLALSTFCPPRLVLPARDRPTPLVAGFKVANAGKGDITFDPASITLLLQWGNGRLAPIGINRNGVGKRPAPVTLKPGQSWVWASPDARLAYIGNPKYLAFWGGGLVPGEVLEQALGEPAARMGIAARYEKAQPRPLTCEPVICRIDERGVAMSHVASPSR